MRCYFQKTGTVENIPIEKISLIIGAGVHGINFLRNIEKNQEDSPYAWGARKIDGIVYLESFCVNILKLRYK